MAKKQLNVPLTGVDASGTPVKSTNCADVVEFVNTVQDVTVVKLSDNKVSLVTLLGEYVLDKHQSLNSYHGTCSGYKVRIVLKKMVGTLTSWV